MHITPAAIASALLLVVALSMDAFTASFAYGTNKIKIPFFSVLIITVVCSSILALSLFLGNVISPLLPSGLTKQLCFAILLILGIIKLFDSSIKIFIQKHANYNKELKLSLSSLNLILTIYADPERADMDASRELSPKEAASLAIALSLDGFSVGIGTGLAISNVVLVIGLNLWMSFVAVILGSYLGYQVAKKTPLNLSWLSGILLILLAMMKL